MGGRFKGAVILPHVAADPSTLEDGQLWYRSDTDQLMLRANGISQRVYPQPDFWCAHITADEAWTADGALKALSGMDIALPTTGTYRWWIAGSYGQSAATNTTMRLRYSGTSSLFKGSWLRAVTTAWANNIDYTGNADTTTNSNTSMAFQAYGLLVATGTGTIGLSATTVAANSPFLRAGSALMVWRVG